MTRNAFSLSSTTGRARVAALFSVLLCSSAAAQTAPVVFHGLGDLAGGDFSSTAHAISADGSTVVGESWNADTVQGFRWTETSGLVSVGSLTGPGGDSVASGVSGDGSIVVGQSASTSFAGEAFRWTQATGPVGLGVPAGAQGSAATAISADGAVIIGNYSIMFDSHAFRWTNTDGFSRINNFAGDDASSNALALAADGSVIGGCGGTATDAPLTQATLWSGGGGASLGVLASTAGNSAVQGLSDDGAVAVGWSQSDNGIEAFRWAVDTGLSSLGALPAGMFLSFANAVSADGAVVVGRAYTNTGPVAFIWTSGSGMIPLDQYLADQGVDLTGWSLTEAVGISADGLVIVGNGWNPEGNPEAWIANLRQPDPAGGGGDDEGGDDNGSGGPPTCDHGSHHHQSHGDIHPNRNHPPSPHGRDHRDAMNKFFANAAECRRRRVVAVRGGPARRR